MLQAMGEPKGPNPTKKTININTINVKISTNIPDQPDISLTKQLLVVKTPNYKKYNEYPFITGSIRIRKGILPISYAERMDFFFIKERFKFLTNRISSEGGIDTNYVDEAIDDPSGNKYELFKQNIKRNIYLLLNCVFITYPMMNNIISSKSRTQLDIDTPMLIDRYSYVSVGSQKYTVARVVLIDDIYNHYAFEQLRLNNEEFDIWKINEQRNLAKKIDDAVDDQKKLFESTYKDIDYEEDIKKCVQSLSDATIPSGGYVTNRRENDIYIRALEDVFKALVIFSSKNMKKYIGSNYRNQYKDDLITMLETTKTELNLALNALNQYDINSNNALKKLSISAPQTNSWGSSNSKSNRTSISNAITKVQVMIDTLNSSNTIIDLKTTCDDINKNINLYTQQTQRMIPTLLTNTPSKAVDNKITPEVINKTLDALKLLSESSDFVEKLNEVRDANNWDITVAGNLTQSIAKLLYELQQTFMNPPTQMNGVKLVSKMNIWDKLREIESEGMSAILDVTNDDKGGNTRKYTDFIVRTNDALSTVGKIGISNQTKLLVNALNTNAQTLQKYLNEQKYVVLDDNTLRMGIDEYKNEKYKKLSSEINKNIKLIQKMINYKNTKQVKALKTEKDVYDKLITQLDMMADTRDTECGLIFDNDKSPSYEVYIYLDLIKGQVTDTNNNLNICGFKDGILKSKVMQMMYNRDKKIEHDPLITIYEKPVISSKNKTRKAMPIQQPNNMTRRQLPTQIPQPQQ
jgi:hypothetical protein